MNISRLNYIDFDCFKGKLSVTAAKVKREEQRHMKRKMGNPADACRGKHSASPRMHRAIAHREVCKTVGRGVYNGQESSIGNKQAEI
jgi:hypothetical protein